MKKNYNPAQANLTGIYSILNIVTNDIYIGQTANGFRVRYNAHISQLHRNCHGNQRLQRAWNKYGADSFVFSILEEVSGSGTEMEQREQYWTDSYRRTHEIINFGKCVASPRLGLKNSPEAIRKTADAHRGRKETDETRERMSRAVKQRYLSGDHPMKGKKHTKQSLEKMRRVKLGKRLSAETKLKMGQAHLGIVTAAKPFPAIINIDTGEVVSGTNLSKFCRERGLSRVCMGYVFRGKQRSHKGWQLHES